MDHLIENYQSKPIDSFFEDTTQSSQTVNSNSSNSSSNSKLFLQQMSKRRSVREFLNKSVDDEIILNAIRTAASAPSGANRQPWHFSVVKNPDIKRKIRENAEKIEQEFYSNPSNENWIQDLKYFKTKPEKTFLEVNSHLIVVSAKTRVQPLEKSFVTHRSYYARESVSISIGLLLASLQLSGVSTLTHTPKPADFLCEVLNLDCDTKPIMIVVAGIAAPSYEPPVIKRRPEHEIISVF